MELFFLFASKQFKCQRDWDHGFGPVRDNLSESVLFCGNRCLMMKWSPESLIRCVNMKSLLLYNRKGGGAQGIRM
jgi:hypothetical protein